jgi:hypothetical protein
MEWRRSTGRNAQALLATWRQTGGHAFNFARKRALDRHDLESNETRHCEPRVKVRLQSIRAKTCSRAAKNFRHPPLAPW